MPFPPDVAERLLVACHRHCCICHKPSGNKIEIHHIVPRSKGGDDSGENGIPLCFDCHAEVEAYNPDHPKGRRFTPSELRRHKEQWFVVSAQPPWAERAHAQADDARDASVDDLVAAIHERSLWNPDVSGPVLPSILKLNDEQRDSFVDVLAAILRDDRDDEVRWNAALAVEFFIQWDPQKVPNNLLATMANDAFFSVRSSAAVSYYELALAAPTRVPIEVVSRLASYDEDWYVMTPATATLLRLARSREAAVRALASDLDDEREEARQHVAHTLRRLARGTPEALRHDVAERLIASGHSELVEVGEEWRRLIDEAVEEDELRDYSAF